MKKAELICFQNGKLFKEYAIRIKTVTEKTEEKWTILGKRTTRTITESWEYVKNDKGIPALFRYAEAQVMIEELGLKVD